MATNGVIHVVEKVINLPTQNIADLVKANSELSSLLDAVTKTGLASVLAQKDQYFTVFAPVNSAFATIQTVAAGLTMDELKQVLLAHLSEKVLFAGNINNEVTLPSLNKSVNLAFSTNPVMVKIKEKPASTSSFKTKTTDIDIIATNGVIHLINAVLVP